MSKVTLHAVKSTGSVGHRPPQHSAVDRRRQWRTRGPVFTVTVRQSA